MDLDRVTLRVTIDIVNDETTDLPALLDAIDGAAGTLDVRGFRFDCTVKVGA